MQQCDSLIVAGRFRRTTMPIRKHPDSGIWWVDLRTPDGKRVRRTTGTKDKKAAQEYHDRLKAEFWRTKKLGEQPERTFDEAAIGFLKLSEGQRDYETKIRHVQYWRDALGGNTQISFLTSTSILNALPTHRKYEFRPTIILSAATKNRYLATIRRILSLCVEWGWIVRAPKLSKFEEPDVRVRWEQRSVIIELIKAISTEWMREVALFAVSTGMRANEVLSLKWSQIDMQQKNAWITHSRAKSKRARSVPLNADALAVIQRRIGKHDTLVFTRPARTDNKVTQIKQVDAEIFKKACNEICIEDFHFHDLRHTWASWHVQAGTPLMVLKELGGWERIEMVQKYAHLAPSHLANHAETVTFWSQQTLDTKKPTSLSVLSA